MKNSNIAACGVAIIVSIVLTPSIAQADTNAASNKAREGIVEFKNRDFKAALKAFEDAERAAPDDLRLAFDRGCAYAAAGEAEKAIEQFQKSASGKDRKLTALSNYNLGCVEAGRAKAKFGVKPEDAEGDAREQGLKMIETAGRHFRDALNTDSQDEDARYNLETLRAWSRYVQTVWKQRDRERRREKLNLLEYLQMLETDQRGLRTKAKELQGIAEDSPRKRQSIREAADAQRELIEEIGPLKQKIDGLAAGQGRGGAAAAALPPDAQKAVELLKTIADQVGASMQAASDRLADNSPAESIAPQTSAIENLDQVFSAVAPYVNLVQRGIGRQEELIGEKDAAFAKEEAPEARAGKNETVAKTDIADAAWNQQFIERYGKIIPLKAKQELKQLESQGAVTAPSSPPADSPQPQSEEAQKDAALKTAEQRRELKEALQLGIDLSPKVEQLAREAADLLSQEKSAEALPKQQDALKLLKEMLPKQQQQEQDKKDKEKQDQQKKDQQKKDQDKQDQQKKDQDKKDQEKEKQDQQKKDEKKKDQAKKDQEKKDQSKQEQKKDKEKEKQSAGQTGQKQEMSKEQAEDLLRRAQLRQERHKELQKEVEGYLYRPEKVEKDW
jgi:hypothetical protein